LSLYLRFENKFLISGLILGISLAFISIIEKNNFLEKETDWIAKIEDITISRAKYESQVEGLALDKRSPLTNEDRTFVLERMIEEELLIKRAIDLGILEDNPMARGTMVQQMINIIISSSIDAEPSYEELQIFYSDNIGFFTGTSRLRIKQLYFSDSGDHELSSYERASEVYKLLIQGKKIEEINNLTSPTALLVPNSLLTLSKIREYIGPSLMQIASKLEIGEFTEPQLVLGGYKIIVLLEKEIVNAPNFDDIKEVVISEYKKRQDDKALRDYLENLKLWYDVERNI
tara:strand:- start:106002 stop:106865 length:864 start_codon:yes stop_codon:yes gene_type:complete